MAKQVTITLTEKQYEVLKNFLYSCEYSFAIDESEPADRKVYFSNDTTFSCSKRDYNALKKAIENL